MGIWRYQCFPPGALRAANQNFNDCRRQSYHSVSAPSPTGPQAKTKSARPKPCIGFGRAVLSISSGQYRTMDTAEALPGVSFHPQQFPPKKQLGQAFKTLARLPRQEYLPLGYAIFIAVNAQASSADSTDARPYSVPPYDDIVILSGSAFRSHWTAVSAKARTTGSASP